MGADKNIIESNVATSSSSIYEGGTLSQITIKDLKNNEVAIRQLINTHNALAQKYENAEQKSSELKSSLEHIKTTPFMAIVSSIINVIGTIIVGIGVNQCSSNENNINALIILGGMLIVLCNAATICYPYSRKWFNK
jgi:predicted nuclease with TOPRIM domain